MNFLITLAALAGCFALMAIGLIITKKALRKGCSVDPDSCACKTEGKDPASCDKENKPASR